MEQKHKYIYCPVTPILSITKTQLPWAFPKFGFMNPSFLTSYSTWGLTLSTQAYFKYILAPSIWVILCPSLHKCYDTNSRTTPTQVPFRIPLNMVKSSRTIFHHFVSRMAWFLCFLLCFHSPCPLSSLIY